MEPKDTPDGHPKLLHLWPVKLLQAGRGELCLNLGRDGQPGGGLLEA